MDIIQLERELTNWAAQVLGLTVDSDIFRGGIPSGRDTGVGVMLHTEIKDTTISQPTFNAQIFGKFRDRDDAWRMLNRISRAIPCYGVQAGTVIFTSISPRGNGEPYSVAEDNGTVKICASANIIISALTK